MGFNGNLFEVNVYPESYDMTKLQEIFDNHAIRDYAYIIHDKDIKEDGLLKKSHCHIAIRCKEGYRIDSDYVAKWFGVPASAMERVKGRWSDILKYLTHKNAREKYQYSDDEVISNFDVKKAIESSNDNKRIDEIISDIGNGKIREYNYTRYITDVEYIKFKRQIESAFNYRKDRIKGERREMESIFISGDAGFGKTTYAKLICDEKGYSYFVSSGSNDVLDGYMGEDVIILDDLRPSCMGLSDLLKMLDNHTASTVKSRYKNKVLECKMIIITTVMELDTFFHNVFTEDRETIIQLKRRCKTYIKMNRETMDIYVYDDYLRDYEIPFTAKNPICNLFKAKKLSKLEQMEKIKKLLGNVEIEENDSKLELVEENVQINVFKEEK